jgi:hypothetical protein
VMLHKLTQYRFLITVQHPTLFTCLGSEF